MFTEWVTLAGVEQGHVSSRSANPRLCEEFLPAIIFVRRTIPSEVGWLSDVL